MSVRREKAPNNVDVSRYAVVSSPEIQDVNIYNNSILYI